MAKIKRNAPKNIRINDNITFTYWNQNDWEFGIDGRNISEEQHNRYQVLAAMLVNAIAPRGIPSKALPGFVKMSQEAFAL